MLYSITWIWFNPSFGYYIFKSGQCGLWASWTNVSCIISKCYMFIVWTLKREQIVTARVILMKKKQTIICISILCLSNASLQIWKMWKFRIAALNIVITGFACKFMFPVEIIKHKFNVKMKMWHCIQIPSNVIDKPKKKWILRLTRNPN